jgi:hypothetical protein
LSGNKEHHFSTPRFARQALAEESSTRASTVAFCKGAMIITRQGERRGLGATLDRHSLDRPEEEDVAGTHRPGLEWRRPAALVRLVSGGTGAVIAGPVQGSVAGSASGPDQARVRRHRVLQVRQQSIWKSKQFVSLIEALLIWGIRPLAARGW